MMPFQDINPDNFNPPAISRPAEDLSGYSFKIDPGSTSAASNHVTTQESRATALQQSSERQISNRPDNADYTVVYVNGIRTTEADAKLSASLVRRSLGAEDSECRLVYNPREHALSSGLKIFGAAISTKLGKKAESGCIQELQEIITTALHKPSSRLTVVGHSQGSLVIHNAFDKVFDEFNRSPETRKLWDEVTPRIEVIMYAPLVRTLAPGPQAVALLNGLDLPARSLGATQRAVAASKHFVGYREQQAIRTVVYHPESNDFPDVIFNPQSVHESFQLILDSPEFNFKLLSQNPQSKDADARLFSTNLYTSILYGRRSDVLHFDLIRLGCDIFGRDFAAPFVQMCSSEAQGGCISIDNFTIDGPRLYHLKRVAE